MAKHRKFNIDRFLAKFEDHEEILRGYVRRWKNGLTEDISSLDVDGFRDLTLGGEWPDKDPFMEGLYRAYDLCTRMASKLFGGLVRCCQSLQIRRRSWQSNL